MKFKILSEMVTKTKYDKYNKILSSNSKYIKELLELDFRDENQVQDFIEKVFGTPKGIYKNTKEMQHKILRRLYDDKMKDAGSTLPTDYSVGGEIGF